MSWAKRNLELQSHLQRCHVSKCWKKYQNEEVYSVLVFFMCIHMNFELVQKGSLEKKILQNSNLLKCHISFLANCINMVCVEYFYKPNVLYINDLVITQNIPYFLELTLAKFTFLECGFFVERVSQCFKSELTYLQSHLAVEAKRLYFIL